MISSAAVCSSYSEYFYLSDSESNCFTIQETFAAWHFFRPPFLGSLTIVYGWFLVCNKFSLLTLTSRSFMVDYGITCESFHSTTKRILQIAAALIMASTRYSSVAHGPHISHRVIGEIPPKSGTEVGSHSRTHIKFIKRHLYKAAAGIALEATSQIKLIRLRVPLAFSITQASSWSTWLHEQKGTKHNFVGVKFTF